MLNDLDSKADKTQTKLDAVNDRMKDALSKINDKSSNFCASTRLARARGARAHTPKAPARAAHLSLTLRLAFPLFLHSP